MVYGMMGRCIRTTKSACERVADSEIQAALRRERRVMGFLVWSRVATSVHVLRLELVILATKRILETVRPDLANCPMYWTY